MERLSSALTPKQPSSRALLAEEMEKIADKAAQSGGHAVASSLVDGGGRRRAGAEGGA